MNQNPQDVIKDLKANKFAPVYFLEGEESYFIDYITKYIEQNAIPEAERGFNQVVLYGKDSNMGQILNNARKFPMMAERQLVVVKEAQYLADINKEESQKLLIGYLQNPLPSTILVFAHKGKKLNGRYALAKEVKKRAVYVESKKISDYKLSEWIQDYFKSLEHDIDFKAVQLLADSIGNNLDVITNEIDKMIINFKEPTKITTSHVAQYVGINKEYNNFELMRAIGYRDVVKANKIANYFVQNPKAHPVIPIFSLLYNYFMRIALVQNSKNASDTQLAGELGVPPFAVKEYRSASNNYKLGKVIDVFGYLKEADLRYKGVDSVSMSESDILRELLFKILH
ncbi:DNA polymerase III subunit delta [Algoriphagus namhaensis]|uniref:DNA polymerase III subunit delta n=1 Tax=Algoriphagus namhaensis TaxID=915353 RepID=A0ABV8AV63_9BACT